MNKYIVFILVLMANISIADGNILVNTDKLYITASDQVDRPTCIFGKFSINQDDIIEAKMTGVSSANKELDGANITFITRNSTSNKGDCGIDGDAVNSFAFSNNRLNLTTEIGFIRADKVKKILKSGDSITLQFDFDLNGVEQTISSNAQVVSYSELRTTEMNEIVQNAKDREKYTSQK
jgi:hypothetical protein